jgi:hypothetical protein
MVFISWSDCDGDGASGGAPSSNNAHCSYRCLAQTLGPQTKAKKLKGLQNGVGRFLKQV